MMTDSLALGYTETGTGKACLRVYVPRPHLDYIVDSILNYMIVDWPGVE